LTRHLGKNDYHLHAVPDPCLEADAVMCHECLMAGQPSEASTGLCRFCFVALCKTHLMELYANPPSFPQYGCRHLPANSPSQPSGRRVAASPHAAPRAKRERNLRLTPGFGGI
jgi:hypothetical protein